MTASAKRSWELGRRSSVLGRVARRLEKEMVSHRREKGWEDHM